MIALPPHLKTMTPKERVDHESDVLKMLTADTVSLLLEDLGIGQNSPTVSGRAEPTSQGCSLAAGT